MKIIEVKCRGCQAEFEILENFPKEFLSCPGCGGKELKLSPTEREFEGCESACLSCNLCDK